MRSRKPSENRRKLFQQLIDEALESPEASALERVLGELPSLSADERQRLRQALDELDRQSSNGNEEG